MTFDYQYFFFSKKTRTKGGYIDANGNSNLDWAKFCKGVLGPQAKLKCVACSHDLCSQQDVIVHKYNFPEVSDRSTGL